MPTKTTKRKGPIGHGMETVAQAGAYLDRQLGGMVGMNPREVDGYPVVKKEADAYAVYDADLKEIVAYAPGHLYSLSKSKALRERGTGHKVYFIGFPDKKKNPAKFERCVKDVEARGEDVNAYAVCTAAGTRKNPSYMLKFLGQWFAGFDSKGKPKFTHLADDAVVWDRKEEAEAQEDLLKKWYRGEESGERNPSVMEFAKKDAAYAYARLMEAEGWVAKVVRRGFKWGVELVKQNPRKPTIYEALESKLGRAPTNAELKADVERIKTEALVEMASKGKLVHQRKGRGRRNPEGAAAEMYESFHGQPSEEVTEFVEDLHYHENLAELGVLAGVVVETEYAGVMALAFSGYKWDNREGAFELKAGRENPLFGGLFGGKTTHYSVKHGTKTTTTGKLNYKGHQIVSIGGEFEVPSVDPESRFDSVKEAKRFIDEWSKNPGLPVYTVPMSQSHRVVQYGRGLVKLEAARREAKKIGSRFIVKVEDSTGAHVVYLTPDPRFTLEDLSAIPGARTRLSVQNPDPTNSDTTLLASNEKGTQLFLVGGDQSVDIDSFKLKGAEAEHESIVLGNVQQITYHTSKIFEGKREEFDYWHNFSEDTKGPLPTLIYDAVNQRLTLSGGCYKINKPLFSTSPGLED